VSAKEIVMRPSRFFVLMFVSFFLAGASPAQTVTTVVNFNGANGAYPYDVTLVQGRDGRLYGTTANGGANGLGAVIRINLSDNNSVVLHSFSGTDGSGPGGGLTLASNGYYYGTAGNGGSSNLGVLYSITSAGTYTVLHNFGGGSDGLNPYAPPIQASDGNFYGTTAGIPNSNNPATMYKYTSSGVYSVIYTFDSSISGVGVYGLTQGADGLLYGAAYWGGADNCGTIVKLTTAGILKETHSFNCASGGGHPIIAPILASDDNLYGTTQADGEYSGGILYEISNVFGVNDRYNFDPSLGNGGAPDAGLVQGSDGNLYGVTSQGGGGWGVIYNWNLDGTYDELSPMGNGFFVASLMQNTNGLFYGVSELGGSKLNYGYVYSFNNGLGPFVTFVKSQGKVGSTAQILGQGLTGTTSVTFNGIAATSFAVVSDTYMTAVAPSGATTGPVVVTTPSGTLTSNVSFRITN
jgi:uncharacterized repeat protein (TIGR03803 family)